MLMMEANKYERLNDSWTLFWTSKLVWGSNEFLEGEFERRAGRFGACFFGSGKVGNRRI